MNAQNTNEVALAALAALKGQVSEEPLHESGRYFDETYDDLTKCHHGETGNYSNKNDGQAVALLWNLWKAGALDRLYHPQSATASVQTMKTSAGADYFVHLRMGEREITPHVYKIPGRAEYDVAYWQWFFGQSPEKPDMFAFETGDQPSHIAEAPAISLEVEIARLKSENERLRQIVSKSAVAIGNGAAVAPECSVEFMEGVPREIELHVSSLRKELKRCSDHLKCYHDSYPQDSTADVAASLWCAARLVEGRPLA